MEHDVLVAQQFGATARAYLESVTHATGEDLEMLGAGGCRSSRMRSCSTWDAAPATRALPWRHMPLR